MVDGEIEYKVKFEDGHQMQIDDSNLRQCSPDLLAFPINTAISMEVFCAGVAVVASWCFAHTDTFYDPHISVMASMRAAQSQREYLNDVPVPDLYAVSSS